MRPLNLKWSVASIVLAVLLILPFTASGYVVRFLTFTFMFLILAESWNLFGGYTGYTSFGHVAFFGIGAYSTAICMVKLGIPFCVSAILGGAFSALMALLLATVLFRMKSHYFVMGSLGVAEVTREIVSNMTKITGGGMGLTMPILPWEAQTSNTFFYFLMFGVAVLTVITTVIVVRSRSGYAFLAIRDGELVASVLGINTVFYKTFCLALSSFFPALAGGIYAYWMTYVEPASVFDIKISILMLVMAFLGGRGTVLGPILGAFLLQVLSEIFWAKFITIHTAILGVVMVIVILFLPGGIVELVKRGREGFSLRWLRENLNRYRV